MLRYLFEGYADVITLATTLRPPRARSASQSREVAPEQAELTAATSAGGSCPRSALRAAPLWEPRAGPTPCHDRKKPDGGFEKRY